MSTFRLPDLGEGLQEAEIVAWMVAAGDRVVADQPLVAVETDKAVVEVPAPISGTVAALKAEVGDMVPVGAPLVEFAEGDSTGDLGTVVGALQTETPAGPKPSSSKPQPPSSKTPQTARAKAAPAIRAYARDQNVDLATVTPSGAHGEITRADIDGAIEGGEDAGWEPIRGVLRAMARNMAASHAEIASATVSDDADVNAWAEDTNVLLRLIRAVGAGVAASPVLNAWFDSKRERRLVHQRVNLGIAVDTEAGLFVPVLNDITRRTDDELAAGLVALKADVQARTIPHEQLTGQTITLSNFGTIGGRYGQLAIVAPQVAILGAGRIRPDVMPMDTGPQIRRILPLSLTFDHRVVTGGEAARFLNGVIADLSQAR